LLNPNPKTMISQKKIKKKLWNSIPNQSNI
jgi:hypothetical protein